MKIAQNQMSKIIEMAKDYGEKRLILFGSYLPNPDDARDLDLELERMEVVVDENKA